MTRTVLAIIAILLCTTAAWAILGATILARTYSADSGLGPKVDSSWGGEHQQTPPAATTSRVVSRQVQETTNNSTVVKTVQETVTTVLPLERSRLRVNLDLEQLQKGLLWFATYRVGFHGDYAFRNTSDSDEVLLKLAFPAPKAIYDDLVLRVDGQQVPTMMLDGAVTAKLRKAPGSVIQLETGYRSQGTGVWRYSFGENIAQVRDLLMDMTTNFDAVDFPAGTLSPTMKRKTSDGWLLTWKYTNLITGSRIGMVMPEKLQPGPLAGRISFFAPASLLFFFFLIFIISTLKGIELHPMHYFFLAAAFFSFHLLLAYLVDHISIHAAFIICSAVSIFLVVSYMRVVVGQRFAFVETALTQLVYLVGFSYAFFFKGFTGLAVTIGAIVSLFIVMQLTARIDWRSPRAVAR
ncbi:MAG: inner membrane CreD family protein [Thermoanaerobaculia bacterium]